MFSLSDILKSLRKGISIFRAGLSDTARDLLTNRIACFTVIDLSPFKWNFDLDMPGQKFHHSLKEHHKISNIPKFRCEML
jgi:hypothetical protein